MWWKLKRVPARMGVLSISAVIGLSSCLLWADQPTVSLGAIPAVCKTFAVAVGQRLQKPGKERTTGVGTLSTISNGVTQASSVQVVWQYPQKIRVEGAGPTIVFDPSRNGNGPPLSPGVSDILEALVNDSVEGMIAITTQSGAARFLGAGFRDKGTAASYDIVQVFFPDAVKNGSPTIKAYWFNSVTKLLSKVTYRSVSGGLVEVSVGNWQKVQGDTMPFLVERRENGVLTLRLTLSAVTVSAGAQDGIFGGN
jgi:hypothetical protein